MIDSQERYQTLNAEIQAAYSARVPKSRAWFERASKSLVGGVSGTVRYFKPFPLYFAEGTGSHTVDLDGHDYIDHFLSGACLLLGHRHPEIMQAVSKTANEGSLLLNNRLSTELAEMLQKLVPCAEKVRLLNSGTEAVMSALRFARSFTGRSKIVKFQGTYHGQGDDMLVGLDDDSRRVGSGITDAAVSETVMAKLGDFDSLGKILDTGSVAAVLVDPSMHHCGLWVGSSEDYTRIKNMAHKAGALLIFDEVISGFRLAAGGAQTHFNVVPDLAVFGKAMGAGEKLGAVVGKAEIMNVADPARNTPGPFAYQSGTGNDVRNSIAASLAALKVYKRMDTQGEYQRLSERADSLGRGLQGVFENNGLACEYNQLGPMVRLFLSSGPFDYHNSIRLDPRPVRLFHLALLTEGVLTLPGSNDFFLSFSHTDKDIENVVAAADRVLKRFDFKSIAPLK